MLNISQNTISESVPVEEFKSYKQLKNRKLHRISLWFFVIAFVIFLIILFLPWTQNINAKGYVNTRSPQQRPQSIQSVIPGRIEEWFVKEGDYVDKGDTIAFLTEVKSEYFDPNLLERTSEQIDAKSKSVNSYDQKIAALNRQYEALLDSRDVKLRQNQNKIIQAQNKIKSDSIDLVSLENNYKIIENQLSRTQELYDKGLKTLTELQEKQYKLQEATAKLTVQRNKLLNQQNELANLQLEVMSVNQNYEDKLAKSQSDRQSALSSKYETMAETSKLQNQYSNYNTRKQFYYVTAPQSGYITKTLKKGIGETIKEGTDIVSIMPSQYDLAVEVYVKPQDIPLLQSGNSVQLRFDGWPAIVISGWPKAFTGVFTGEIVSIDKFIGENGYYRIIIVPMKDEKAWPSKLSIGTGVNSFILLGEVPIWYEAWRQLNGFPPDYYQSKDKSKEEIKRKAPLKSIK